MSFRHDDGGFYPGQPVEWDGLDGHVGSGQFMWWAQDIDGLKAITRTPNDGFFSIPPEVVRPVEREPRVGDIVEFTILPDGTRGVGRILTIYEADKGPNVAWGRNYLVRVDKGTAPPSDVRVEPKLQHMVFTASAMP